MRLRNKRTGKVNTCDMVVITDEKIDGEIASLGRHTFIFRSIEQFNDRYEGYKPVEPLIKDEKKRKLVRDWAEMNGIKVVLVCETFNAWGVKNKANGNPEDEEYMLADILFSGNKPEELEFGKEYTITELCGEEGECA